jgi:hypothetical protein
MYWTTFWAIFFTNSSGHPVHCSQGELPSLSKYWLSALKDHALLSLPAEFKSQLPFEGGAFYSNDTVESARPHYRATWYLLTAFRTAFFILTSS